ncbi:MAG: hypothetical protein WDO18_21815 [Acidobacteriota bacterium]
MKLFALFTLILLVPAHGQAPAAAARVAVSSVDRVYNPPRTADGQPDIQGVYARAGIYGLAVQQLEVNGPHGAEDPLSVTGYNRADASPSPLKVPDAPSPDDVKPQGENSRQVPLIGPPPAPIWRVGLVDPPNKILPWRPEEDKKRRQLLLHTSPPASLRHVEFDARCALPGLFLNGGPFQFIQPEKEVVILSEYQHYTRTIHLDGRPHLGSGVRLFMGDSIGHWEGNTLIVDTTNFNEFTGFSREIPYLSDALHTVERFTVIDENNIDYLVTVDDPKLFTGTWKTAGLYRKGKPGFELLEYACAEGSEALETMFGTPPGK